MKIQIAYQTWDASEIRWRTLSPEEYFDPLEPGETYESDGIPRYNHTWQYLNVPTRLLKWSLEQREGTQDDTAIRTQYLDHGRSWMTHRLDPDGYEELIHMTELPGNQCSIIRTFRSPNGLWAVCLNSMIQTFPDGSQKEQRYDQPWSTDELKSYSQHQPQ